MLLGQCRGLRAAPKARITNGGRFHPEICREEHHRRHLRLLARGTGHAAAAVNRAIYYPSCNLRQVPTRGSSQHGRYGIQRRGQEPERRTARHRSKKVTGELPSIVASKLPLLALKRPSAPPSEGPLTEVLPTRNVRGEFVFPRPDADLDAPEGTGRRAGTAAHLRLCSVYQGRPALGVAANLGA
jgi:hypothetical protein